MEHLRAGDVGGDTKHKVVAVHREIPGATTANPIGVGVGIGIAIGFGIVEVFRFPISTATPIPIPTPTIWCMPL